MPVTAYAFNMVCRELAAKIVLVLLRRGQG
jgi:hypothetical protein